MSVHSTPPRSGHRSNHPIGFNEQTSYDPFFPSSPSDEQLVPVESDRSPYQQSYHSPSPLDSQGSHHSVPRQSPSPIISFRQTPNHTITDIANHNPIPHLGAAQEAADGSFDFLSPNAYISDNAYSGASDHTTTPDFQEGFYLEENFGMLVDPSQNVDLSDVPPTGLDHGARHSSGETEGTRGSVDTNNTRASIGTGIATLSSHLMSPVLTDSGDQHSREVSKSPSKNMGQGKHEGLGNIPSALLLHNVAQGDMTQAHPDQFGEHRPLQITPTETDSSRSNGPSPELRSSTVFPNIARATSPVVRIESYSRGDSPARGESLLPRSGAKRSRSGSRSSHVALERGGSGEAEAGSDYFAAVPPPLISEAGRSGLDPDARYQVSDREIPNFKDNEQIEQIAMKNIDVEEWLDRSENGSDGEVDAPPKKPTSTGKRQRARSTGTQSLSYENLGKFETTVKDSHIPGPGVLLREESGEDEEEDDDDEYGLASLSEPESPLSPKAVPINEIPGEGKPGNYDELPNQPALYRAKVWQDPIYDSSNPEVKLQPLTANDAMMRFEQRAESLDAMSRRGTWGSRRLSESDLHGLLHKLSFSEKTSISGKDRRDRPSSFLQQAAAKLVHRRSSVMRRQDSQIRREQMSVRPSVQEHSRNESIGNHKESLAVPPSSPPSGLGRMSSLSKRPRSPKINTGSAVAAMAFQTGALGVGGSISATATPQPSGWNSLKRQRSKSDVNGLNHAQGHSSSLADMWTQQGGPPMPSLAASPAGLIKKEETFAPTGLADAEPEEEDEDEVMEDAGVTMDLSIRLDSIIPTLEGFKSNIRQLNPRLPPFMFDRIAQEQLRRFKKLLDFKIKHVQAVTIGKCDSGKHCLELGGEPTYLPSKSNGRESEVSHPGFSVAGLGQSDEDVNALAEGIVTPAQFPPGVPMPPVKRLPAEFECSLCFKVKKFHKPSDWSKHVHEDVQPFTCTFATCAEPKSFKRKADWVRHENERHRQLEWWMCNMNDCSHRCYRKDNFVQHLVREHKLPEPKVKTSKAGKPAVRGPSSQKTRMKKEYGDDPDDEIDQVWKLVDECRHETPKNPKDEACKFCGNVCNSWKKLTVHLAKHMEQISMPVLGVVKQKEVTPETIISPIEQRLAAQNSMSPTMQSPWGSQTGQASQSAFSMPISNVNSGYPTSGNISTTAGGLTPGSNYFSAADQQMSTYQRVSPNTYPPPSHTQHSSTSYTPRPSPLNPMSSYGSQNSHNNPPYSASPASHFNSVNRGISQSPVSSSDSMYGGIVASTVPMSHQPPSLYDANDGYQYMAQQQQTFQSPVDTQGIGYQFSQAPSGYTQQIPASSPYTHTASSYPPQRTPPSNYVHNSQMSPPVSSYRGQQTTPPTSYPQPSQMTPPVAPTGYGQQSLNTRFSQLGGMQGYTQAHVDTPLFAQQQNQQQGHGGQGYGQGQC